MVLSQQAAIRTRTPISHHVRMGLWGVCSLTAALSFGLLAGCGDDDTDAPAASAGTSGGGSGGTASNAGTSGAAGARTNTPPPPVACGATQCSAPSNPITSLISQFGGGAALPIPTPAACCLDEAAGTCGVTASTGGACEAPSKPDARCPAINLGMFGGLAGGAMQGCCIDNKCGQDGSLFGRGCVENSQAQSMLMPLLGGFATIPAPQACDAAPPTAGTGDDAGVGEDDAGTPAPPSTSDDAGI
ncbi:MAG: hypothetical protein ABW321_35760 [Polyangiales bacterium]